ncbi:MAG: hypothetical protein C0601_09400 [Candidatus Muiribacterium halophilum]|uniref:Chemotaxis phosphatase CheX-like domain-containing protein n=1 Tax=Muiribacterium halophilum TaxID=2053465 RepID=A0A2N5ZDD9_MUIH1|nr:MAG: hypothetical protein C0601_09400 [Candidatus Muirbacterium halophilum]
MEIKEKIDQVFTEVFENVGFIFADRVEAKDIEETDKEDFIIAYITLKGEVAGDVIVMMELSIASEFTANMMGLDFDEVPEEEFINDATKELSNILCGNIASKVFGKEKDFDISIPIVNQVSKKEMHELIEDNTSIFYSVDERPLIINYKFK